MINHNDKTEGGSGMFDDKKNSADARKRFEEQFSEEVKEKIFLVRKKIGKGSKSGAYMLAGTRCLAWVDCETGELHDERAGIRRMYKPGLFADKSDFKAPGIYRVRVRENRNRPTDHMLVKILREAEEPRLQAILEEYLKPAVINCELGTFELVREYDQYQGEISLKNDKIPVYLELEEGTKDAEVQLNRLREICRDLEGFDAGAREFISRDEVLWDWLEDGGYEREGFEQKLGAPLLTIGPDGEVSVWYDGGEPFGGHSIVVGVDENGEFNDINLVG